MKFRFIAILLSLLAIFSIAGFAAKNSALLPSEEFNGPFANWKNLKTDFKAVGDGIADDTAAFKAGLDSLAIHGKGKAGDPYVLFLPAGTYRITAPLVLENRLGIAILGEDSAKTKVIYDGPAGEIMLDCHGVSYSKFGRITWDGQGKARAAVAHQWNPVAKTGPAVTYMEHADEVFQNVDRGIIGGAVVPQLKLDGTLSYYNHGMDAETLVKRCRFIHCKEAGLSIQSFNALDWWVWDSEFIDCGVGATNCANGEYGGGHFHLYRCLFRNSSTADIRTGHCSYFGIRLNTSIGSRRFLETIRPAGFNMPGLTHQTIKAWGAWTDADTYGSQHALQGNTIINPTDPTPIVVNQHGPLMLIDNTFVVKPAGETPVVQMNPPTDGAQCVSIGNNFYGASQVVVKGELTEQDNKIYKYSKYKIAQPFLPIAAPCVARQIFEIKPGANGEEIQKAIDEAVKLNGKKPVVHLPAGRFPVSKTLVIPANSDLQLIGDGVQSLLIWEGANNGTMLKISGPSRATLRDFRIAGIWNTKWQVLGRGIVVENIDQKNGQILLEQANAENCTRLGMLFNGLADTRVEMRGAGSGGNTGPGITVIGGKEKSSAWVGFFGGAGSNNQQTHLVKNGGRMVVWDTWYETAVSKKDSETRYIHLTDKGYLSFFNGHIATLPGQEARRDLYTVDLENFTGSFTLIGAAFNTMNPQMRLAGTGKDMNALVMGTSFGPVEPYFNNQTENAKTAILSCRKDGKNILSTAKISPEFLRDMLKDIRTILPTQWQPSPAGATDLRIFRVTVYTKVGEGFIFSADKVDDMKDSK